MTKLKPILFSTEMVQAILEGRKTMTRRIIKPQPKDGYTPKIYKGNDQLLHLESRKSPIELEYIEWNVIQKDTILWVRETYSPGHIENGSNTGWQYKADNKGQNIKWKPSLFMPKEAARIFLKVTKIRVERLHDITEEDAIAEGVLQDVKLPIADFKIKMLYRDYTKATAGCADARSSFMTLWKAINGEASWKENPYVWVIEFERFDKPENF